MKHTLLVVSCLSLGLGAAGCAGGHGSATARAGAVNNRDDCVSGFARDDGQPAQPKLKGAAVGNYNKGYTDGVNASAFFNKGQPMNDQQVDRLIEIGRRQGDPTGLLAQPGYADGYRTGATHSRNPYEKQMTAEQVAQVRKAQGLPPAVDATPRREDAQASARPAEKKQDRDDRKDEKKSKRGHGKESAEASAR